MGKQGLEIKSNITDNQFAANVRCGYSV